MNTTKLWSKLSLPTSSPTTLVYLKIYSYSSSVPHCKALCAGPDLDIIRPYAIGDMGPLINPTPTRYTHASYAIYSIRHFFSVLFLQKMIANISMVYCIAPPNRPLQSNDNKLFSVCCHI